MFLLMSLVIVPVARGVAALPTLVRLLPRVPQHVPLQVHALVAAVAAHRALERLGARVHALVPLQVGQVAACVIAQMALVRLLARVHSVVPLQVVEVRRGVVALWALVWFLTAVGFHVTRQVVGVMSEERAGGAGVHFVAALTRTVGGRRRVLRQHFQCALGADLRGRSVLVLEDNTAQPTSKREKRGWEGGAICRSPSGRPVAASTCGFKRRPRLMPGGRVRRRYGWRRRSL